MSDPGGRTDEEREAARREREARRAARAGGRGEEGAPPAADGPSGRPSLKLPSLKLPSLSVPGLSRRKRDEPDPEDAPPPAPPPRSVVSRQPPTAPPPPASARPPARQPKRPPVARSEARPPTKRLPRPGDAAPGLIDADAEPHTGSGAVDDAVEAEPLDAPGQEAPKPPRRRLPRLSGRVPRPGAAGGEPPSGESFAGTAFDGPPRRRLGRRLAVLGVIAAVLGLIAVWFLVSLFQPFGGEGEGKVRVTIPAGTSIGDVADLLEERGVVKSAFFFQLRARTTGQREDIKQGTFTLKRDMSYTAALVTITTGPPANVVNVTVPEGRSRREVAPITKQAGLKGSYSRLTRRSPVLNPRAYGARRATNLEGFLFPSTYELKKKGATTRALVRDQLRTFKREFRKVDLRAARRRKLSPYDVLIIASMVDRETLLPRERRTVASVIYNRLRDRIPLGIDATIRFATNNWTRPLRESELAIDSPYNTRENQGLPPGPIGSPGLAAIKAAANPAKTKFIYYVVKPGTCGQHAFSTNDAQFQRDVERYNSEREARGGKSPDSCPE